MNKLYDWIIVFEDHNMVITADNIFHALSCTSCNDEVVMVLRKEIKGDKNEN